MTTTWNPSDLSNVSLSGGNLVATGTAAGNCQVRALDPLGSGKYYFEVVLTTYSGTGAQAVGLASSTHSFSGTYLGHGSSQSIGKFNQNTAWDYLGAAAGAGVTFAQGDRIGVAVDNAAKTIWVTKDGTNWYGSASGANPATGTNGQSYSSLSSTVYPALNLGNGDVSTTAFARTSWTYAAPAGFSEINAPTAPTLNPSDVAGGTPTLSNGNRTIASSIDGTSMVSRSTAGSSGKFYFEGLTDGGSNNSWSVTNGSQALATAGDVEPNKGISIYSNGSAWFWYSDNVPEYGQLSTGNGVAGDRIGVAVDPVNGRIWARLNNGNWNNSGTANPATNTGGINIADFGSTLYGLAWSGYSYVPTTVYFAQSDWAYAAPVGFDQISATATAEDFAISDTTDPNADVVARMHLDARRWAYQYGYLYQALPNIHAGTELPLAVGEPGEADIYQVLQLYNFQRHPAFLPVPQSDGTDVVANTSTVWASTTATSGGGALRHSDLTLSGDSLAITNPGSNYTVNSKLQHPPSGKVYLEFVLTTYSDSSVGVASATHDVGTFLSAWSGSCGYNPSAGTVGYGAGDDTAPTASTGGVVSLAVDITAGRMWVRVNGGAWHNSGDPAAGTGGTSYSANFTGAHIAAQIRPGDTLTLRPAAAMWAYSAPSGFTEISTGAAALSVSATQTLALPTQTANVGVVDAASATQTLALPTQTANVGVVDAVSATQTLALPTQTANAAALASVSATQTLDILTATETATVVVAASATQTLVLPTQTANVTTGNTASASANQTLALPTQTANATVLVVASATQTLLLPTQTANAVARVALSATQTLALPTQTATVTVVDPRNVSATQTLALPTQTANAVVVPLSLASANQTLLLPTQTANAVARIAITVSQTMPVLSQTTTVTGPTWQAVAGPGGSWSTSGSASGIWIQQPDPSGTWS